MYIINSVAVAYFYLCSPAKEVIELSIMWSLVTFLVLTAFSAKCVASSPNVTIPNGTVVGRSLPSFKQDLFLGIPYSDPPIRFHPSVSRTNKFSGALDARYNIFASLL